MPIAGADVPAVFFRGYRFARDEVVARMERSEMRGRRPRTTLRSIRATTSSGHRGSMGTLIGEQLVRPVSTQSWSARNCAIVLASQMPQ